MPGSRITKQQVKHYMSNRNKGHTQITSAAKSGFSERTARRVDKGEKSLTPTPRKGRTRVDPFAAVWESEIVPLLEQNPTLMAITLLEYLQDKYPDGEYCDSTRRTLERRVKEWKALYGEEKTLIFCQKHDPGRQGLSDFTVLKGVVITIRKKPLKHLLYHFRLAYSRWSHIKVILGGESFTALSEGLQEALWRLGGCPHEHRTDSLSAAFKNNKPETKKDLTQRYEALCSHYNMVPTRNNLGVSHENGAVESPHGHIKRRIHQTLLLRGSCDFDSVEAYQMFIYDVVEKSNRRNAKNIKHERAALQALPATTTIDFEELVVPVHRTGTMQVKYVTYSVPARVAGEQLRIHLYDAQLTCYLGATHVITLPRIYPIRSGSRARYINYRHLIGNLVKKPQAFRYSILRDDLLPTPTYKTIWTYLDAAVQSRESCKLMVSILSLAAKYDCERALGTYVLERFEKGYVPTRVELESRFTVRENVQLDVTVKQHALRDYDECIVKRELNHA